MNKKIIKIIKSFILSFALISFTGCVNSNTSSSSSNSTSSSTSIEEKYYNINYINDIYTFDGPTSIKNNETLFFSIKDYEDSYTNKRIYVSANDKIIFPNEGLYQIPDINQNYTIRIIEEEKTQYNVKLNSNIELFDIYSNQKIINPNGNYTFFLKFWGDIDLSNVKVKANNTIIYPNSFSKYSNNVLYEFTLNNVNQDINIYVEDAEIYTYYEFVTYLPSGNIHQKSVYADTLDPYKFGKQFVGWTLVENDISTLVELPYKNPTYNRTIKLYAYYVDDNKPLIPTIDINTFGKEINSKEIYTNADITFNIDGQKSTYNASIRLRGNSTLTYPKKPYKIKFNTPTSFFGSEPFKDWVLLADYLDSSLLKNYAGLTFANNVSSLTFKHTLKHFDVNVNGIYQGAYLFTDHIEVNNNGRVQIEEKVLNDSVVPFLLERDFDESGTDGVNMFTIGDNTFLIKYPEIPTKNQFNYIYSYINNVYNCVITGDINKLSTLLNIDSLIDYSLVNEIMVNLDSKWKSGFLYKATNSKLTIGPVWDFDWSFTRWTSLPGVNKEFELKETLFFLKKDTTDFCFEWLTYLIQDNSFYKRIVKRFDEIEKPYLKTLDEITKYYDTIYSLGMRNYYLWYHQDYKLGGKANYTPDVNLFVDQYKYVLSSFQERYEYMDSILYNDNHSFFIDEEFTFIK